MYEMYNPTVLKVEVIKLEKRVDDSLYYLRDAPAQYSTFPFDMEAIPHPPGAPIPVNDMKVRIRLSDPFTLYFIVLSSIINRDSTTFDILELKNIQTCSIVNIIVLIML